MRGATMRRRGATLLAVALALVLLARTGGAEAAEIKVLSAGAVRAIVTELAQAFEKETGHKVSLAFGTAGVTRQRLASEPADVVI
jgi:molybdate transport system substrate-binding protein